jgi:hypothetical protein
MRPACQIRRHKSFRGRIGGRDQRAERIRPDVLGSYATGIGFGVAMLAIGAVALRSGVLLPRWLALVTLATGLAMVTPAAGYVLGEYTVAPCFVLLAVLGVLLLSGSALTGSRRYG